MVEQEGAPAGTMVLEGFTRVRFRVEVPDSTPQDASVYVCGSPSALGRWRARGLKLQAKGDGVYEGEAHIEASQPFTWKITRGHWATVEKAPGGGEMPNRLGPVGAEALEARVAAWADKGEGDFPEESEESALGDVRHILKLGDFGLRTTSEDRAVWVHLPPGYDPEGTRAYPVLYMLDGQNVFDPASAFLGRPWHADKVHDALVAKGQITPFIICAINHRMDRSYEYTPVPDVFFEGGGLDTLADLIEEEIAPALKGRFRVKDGPENTGIMGSSLGGLASFHMGWRYPERFGLAGVISPSLWWAGRYTLKMVSRSNKSASKTRFWIDMGKFESRYPKMLINSTRQLANLLSGRGYAAKAYIDPQGRHDEPSWHRRLHHPFRFLFPPRGA